MATILSGLSKLIANVQSTIDRMDDVSEVVDKVTNAVDRAAPTLKNYENLFNGIEVIVDANIKAFDKLADIQSDISTFGASIVNLENLQRAQNEVDKTAVSIQSIFDAMLRGADQTAKEIQNLQPTLQNFDKAFSAWDKFYAVKNIVGIDKTIQDFSQADAEAKKLQNSIDILQLQNVYLQIIFYVY